MTREECIYFLVLALRWLQDLLDTFLDAIFDYKTKTGRRAERQKAEVKYEHSAQVVILCAGVLMTTPYNVLNKPLAQSH